MIIAEVVLGWLVLAGLTCAFFAAVCRSGHDEEVAVSHLLEELVEHEREVHPIG